MKKLLCICFFFSAIGYTYSQQDAQYSHHMFNQMSVNPGYAGSSEMFNMNLVNRSWSNFGSLGARNFVFSVDAPFTLFEKSHGVGLTLLNDKNPVVNNIGIKLAYAYRSKMKIGDGQLGVGGCFGVYNSSFDLSKAQLEEQGETVGTGSATGNNKNLIYDGGFGVFYKTEKLYMGISATHLFASEYKVNNVLQNNFPATHYYVTAGYVIPMANPMYELKPSFFIQNDGSTTSVTLNSNLVYNNRIWGGLSYRAGQSVTALFGLELLAGVKFGVAYDYETSEFSKLSSGSLEVVVIYAFKLKKEKIPQKYKSIRFL